MNLQSLIKNAMVVALVASAAIVTYAQGSPSVDDSVIAALDAEIAQGGKAEGKATAAKADDVTNSLEAEISKIGEAGGDGPSGKSKESEAISVKQVPSGQNVKVAAPAGQGGERRRASKDTKGVIISAQGRGNTKAGAERAACCMAVVRALRIYAGDEAVKDKFDAVKERMKTVVNDVIDKHEVIEEGQKDGHPVVKVKAWIRKRVLAPKFSDIFPEAFEGFEAEATSPVGRAASSGRNSASSSTGGHGGEGSRATKDSKVIAVTVMGKGETKEEAKLAAFRAAVEKAVGIWVDSDAIMQNDKMLKDRVNTISNADIKRYEMIKEGKKSGLYICHIRAWVEKMAIAPKFASVFPAAFADVGEEASTIHVQKVTRAKRSGDAASLMTAALDGVDRMRKWVRLSVPKGDGIRQIEGSDVPEVPGKGLYAVRYSMQIDGDAYFKGFLPHFKQVLEKIQEGESEECVLTAGPMPKSSYMKQSNLHFIEPFVLSGFPGATVGGIRGTGGNPTHFMFDRYKGVAKAQGERTFNVWLLDKMNTSKTVIRCSAYKIPARALLAYWKALYGDLDSDYVLGNARDLNTLKLGTTIEKVEIALLDGAGEEIAVKIDKVPGWLLTSGVDVFQVERRRPLALPVLWEGANVFDSFFVRPLFVQHIGSNGRGSAYSSEIQRDVYFPLTDAQLERVKKVKVRFVGR